MGALSCWKGRAGSGRLRLAHLRLLLEISEKALSAANQEAAKRALRQHRAFLTRVLKRTQRDDSEKTLVSFLHSRCAEVNID
mmetsp:Transcript_12081/g.17497  ORF Transcript_12081/g.17497 Transcript_12081/m.17497 type:complete len:82 (+) Transcript_12081:423-668(+)